MTGPGATLVLVHGAWHGSWCWERLLPQLAERGIAARTVDLPSVAHRAGQREAGLRDDAAAVREVVDSIAGPVVLCGHSYGGMVISLAGSGPASDPTSGPASRVSGLIYLCAFMPEARQSLVGVGGDQHAPWIRTLDDGMTLPDLALAGEVLYGDCDRATRESAIARLKPQCSGAFTAPVARPAWKSIPSTYIVCARDGALPPQLQRTLFAPRAGRSLELDASHSPFLSQPAALAGALASCL
ncbi:MAG: alpha/beta fold hydrolase [Steroidobacteraceae bacterium]